ncbi:putative sulfate exporter family transporter [Basfia succiniciproducens]|uniref:putative sulfate exporter family transporter n=1 Tax=Basfia succiniciproducens TaxID=653940 RepID=UPI003F74825A
MTIFNSFVLLPQSIVELLITLDNFLLMMSMAALGLTTQVNTIKQAGIKPLILG